MSKQGEFRDLVLYLFDGYPQTRIKESELKEIFKEEKEVKSLIANGFLVEATLEKTGEKQYRLGPHTIDLVNTWKTEELASKVNRLGILVFLFGAGTIFGIGIMALMLVLQFVLK